ncbi:SID1 transmembrane family member 1-like isoform X2 [Phymastichus coffea]|uniref:SID1 transmembrane family member 1-like isoform X2 n=1 Tax=Phymastichus coffea TaxID=108790 RepID=UPI00273B9888|nr:SID1 transmembrane family member 1-like isoform X2 [Phymastichus coffea]
MLKEKIPWVRCLMLVPNALAILVFSTVVGSSNTGEAPALNPIVNIANYSFPYTCSINSSTEFVFLFGEEDKNFTGGARIYVQSEDADNDYPLIVVVRQKKGILSWQVPLLVENKNLANPIPYRETSRTLCPSNYYKDIRFHKADQYVTVSISTASIKNISFFLRLNPMKHEEFYLKSGEKRNYTITPSKPVYFGYDFEGLTDSSSVLISIKSESLVCMTFSIQNTSCPVFDLERNIQYAGYWQTVSKQGGITVPKMKYPNGFFIVLVVNTDDSECSTDETIIDRSKYVEVEIQNSITTNEYVFASLSVLGMFTAFCTIYIIGSICCKVHHSRILREQSIQDDLDQAQQEAQSPIPQSSLGFQEIMPEDDSSLDEDDIDLMEDALRDKDVIRTKLVLSVCDLARKEPKILRKKSRLYVYYLITIAIFYSAPVIQLVVTYQNVLHVTGNQDLCYYNFLCSHPLQFLSDFNHVFSNLGYILLGLLFIFIVYMRERYDDILYHIDRGFGIPQHYGLFYAMGFALMMEGVLSGSYHLCPNHSNFQFDTSFMYIIAVLCMVKIYQNRHPDVNAQAPVTFGVLAITILLGLIGVLDGELWFWILFSIIHLSMCLFLSAQIYYMGRWKFNGGVFHRMMLTMKHDARSGLIYLFRPLYWRRLLLLILCNFCNFGLAVYGNMHHKQDFATYLLQVLMSNLILYTFFYIVMKLCNREKIMFQPLIYLILSFFTWGGALFFFTNKTISWALTPAQSRTHNRPCIVWNFFDYHDIWHFLSALAMFFSFMVLLTLDDDLANAHRTLIPVF